MPVEREDASKLYKETEMLQVLHREVQSVQQRTRYNPIDIPHAICDTQLSPSICSAPFSISQIVAGKEATQSVAASGLHMGLLVCEF